MSNTATFCREQATIQRTAASQAVLENVRRQCDRAAESWEAMATRAERTERLRAAREAKISAAE